MSMFKTSIVMLVFSILFLARTINSALAATHGSILEHRSIAHEEGKLSDTLNTTLNKQAGQYQVSSDYKSEVSESLDAIQSSVPGFAVFASYIPMAYDDKQSDYISKYRQKWKESCATQLSRSDSFNYRKTYGWWHFRINTTEGESSSDTMVAITGCHECTQYDEAGNNPGKSIHDATKEVQFTLHWQKQSNVHPEDAQPDHEL